MIIGGVMITAPMYDIINKLQAETGAIKDVKDLDDNIMVTCPSHKGGNENKPSCGVLAHEKKELRNGEVKTYPKGMTNCFTCGYVATLPEYISNVLGYDDGGKEGTLWLMKNFASVEIENRDLNITFNRGNAIAEKHIITEDELAMYRYTHPYMYKRGLTDDLIEYFDIGYDKETKCLTFPVNNEYGECIFIQRRAVNSKFFKNEKAPKGETLYGIDKIYENIHHVDKLYITESILDALTVWAYGGYAVSMMGLILQPKQLQILKKLPIRVIVIATDNDEYGRKALNTIKNQLKDFKILYKVKYPTGIKDMNDFTYEQFKDINLQII